MRIGIFGGSFDPIHNAHLIAAQSAREQLGLERVLLMVSNRQPLKSRHGASAEQRLEMVRLALEGVPHLVADGREVTRGSISYTVDTLRELAAELPGTELVLLLGTDAARELPRWREAEEVQHLSRIVVFARSGVAPPEGYDTVQVPSLAISSGEIRSRIAKGESIRGWVPDRVADYISGLAMYRTQGGVG